MQSFKQNFNYDCLNSPFQAAAAFTLLNGRLIILKSLCTCSSMKILIVRLALSIFHGFWKKRISKS